MRKYCVLSIFVMLLSFAVVAEENKPLSAEQLKEQLKISKEYWGDQNSINRVIANAYGRNPLHYAAIRNDIMELKRLFLADRSVEINQKDRSGSTPLVLAVKNHKIGSATILMEHGANPMIADLSQKSAVDYAREDKDQEMIDILLYGHRPTQ